MEPADFNVCFIWSRIGLPEWAAWAEPPEPGSPVRVPGIEAYTTSYKLRHFSSYRVCPGQASRG